MRLRACTLLVACVSLLTLAPGRASAQAVTGRVVEQGTLQPLRGVFVFLEDVEGKRATGVLTLPDGRFHLRAPAGRFRLVAELIGHATVRSVWLGLEAGVTLEEDLAIPVAAISLDGLEVEGRARCRRRPAEGLATARVWEEARKALELAQWGEEQELLRLRVVRYSRKLDGPTLGVIDEQRFGTRGYFRRSPYQSLPAEELAREGYVRVSDTAHHDYYAPDAAVLLSASFLDGHCFRVVDAPHDEPGLIGLEFEPVPNRTLPDIQGVIWLDAAMAELRRVDYRYVDLPFRHGDWPAVGGRVEFDRLATGMWIVRRWRIRMPLEMEQRTRPVGSPELALVTLAEQGAEVVSVRTASGELLARAAGATLYGTVTVAPGGDPLDGAVVAVDGIDERAVTAEDGSFRIPGLPDGTYIVGITHALLDILGLPPQERLVELERGRASPLAVEVPLTPAAAAHLCDGSGRTDGWVLLYGRVRDASGPIPEAPIRVEIDGRTHRIQADSAGAYRACLARPSSVRLAALGPRGAGPTAQPPVPVRLSGPGFVRVDLQIVSPADPDDAALPGGAAVTGTVRDRRTESPVEGAAVSLRDTTGTMVRQGISDRNGQFSIPHPAGDDSRFTLTVDHLAYDRVAAELEFPPDQRIRLDVVVSTRPIEIAPIVVRERRQGRLAEVGYYDRRDRSMGVAFDRSDIERRAPSRVADLFRGAGWRVVRLDASGLQWDVRAATTQRLNGRDCQPAIWVDGNRVRGAGEVRRDSTSTGHIQPITLSDLIRPAEIEAIELFRHPSEVPLRFAGVDAACGVVLIWTRRSIND